ncbi:general secretion pathway protein GspB [Acidovorax kalamii]|uniref:Type II secretion system protein GspB C-terminal domain-containing protein n=1 Tax=Acidovorax kalamii TaxID=2004485 RepID=A0A235EN19_9BURK|nr:general secretion pathway protein GspB [Acidovorax kalamii]OYD50438.1 hypothetical protein CBY09_10340 [Acidovorax kalamii]
MSYILDALRRAEAERGRGGVPGLHSQAVPVPGAAPVVGRTSASPWLMASAGVAVAAVAVAGTWWVMQRPAPAPVVVAATPAPGPAPAAVPAAPQPAPVAIAPAPTAPAAQVAPAAGPPSAPAPAVEAPAPESRPAEKRSAAPPPREKAAPPAPVPRVAEPPAAPARSRAEPTRDPARDVARDTARGVVPPRTPEPVAVAAAPAPTTATGTVFAQGDLPEAVRAQLPSLKISGVTYSANPAYRMAIVNGQVLHEGDPAGPGLLLEKIEPGRTIWSFKGYRYGLASQ